MGVSRFSWRFACASAVAGILVAASARAQTKPSLTPFVVLEQDGKRIQESGGTVRLRRAPFTMVFTLSPTATILAHASSVPATYELARSGGAWNEIFARGGSLAEGALNEHQMLYLAEPSSSRYHTWYYDSPADHRFSTVVVDPATGTTVARRTVANVQMPDRAEVPLESYPGEQMFLVLGLSDAGVERGRQSFRLSFAGRPTTAARATPAQERPTALGTAPVRVGGGVPVPRRVHAVEPEYPAVARAAKVEGIVMLEITVSATGSVVDPKVVKSIPLLDQAAIDAVRQWKYEPVRLRGTAVPVIMMALVNFSLGTKPPESDAVPPGKGSPTSPQGGHSAADLAKLKALVAGTGLSARAQGSGYLVTIPGTGGRNWVALTGLSGPYVVAFAAVAQAKDFTVSIESLRALHQLNESVSSSMVSLTGDGTVVISTLSFLRLADGEELKARLENLAVTSERAHEALRPFVLSK